MAAVAIVVYFILYSFLGWIIDTADRSVDAHRFTSGSFFRIPFCPMYGFGALLAIGLHGLIGSWPLYAQFIAYGVALAFLEFAGGELVLAVFHRRLWDYPRGVLNAGRFTNLAHAVAWGALGLLLVLYIHPFVASFIH